MRSNHFHSGVDFKTQFVTGKEIHAPADGFIKRASVSIGGYGKALYVEHPNGYTTVYGHLDRFAPSIDSLVRKRVPPKGLTCILKYGARRITGR